MKSLRFILSVVLAVCLFTGADAKEELTKEQRIAEFAKLPAAERQKPEFFALKLVVKDSAERVAAEPDRLKIKLADNEEIVVLEQIAGGKLLKELLIVEKKARLSRTDVLGCSAYKSPRGWDISIQFTEEGGKKFAETTKQAVGNRIAIILGGSIVLGAPTVMEPVIGGSVSISGNSTQSDAEAFAALLQKP